MSRVSTPCSTEDIERDISSFLQLRSAALAAAASGDTFFKFSIIPGYVFFSRRRPQPLPLQPPTPNHLHTGPNDLGLQAFLRYNYHMQDLVPRLDGFKADMDWQFTWLEGYATGTIEVKSRSLWFDWACMLWNMAAQESMRGAKVKRESDEGIRTACKHFQTSAGVFDFVRTVILPRLHGENLGQTLSEVGLQLSKHLMLAQGQMCFYEKALRDRKAGNMKPGIIAKLASQTSAFYNECYKACLDSNLSRILDPSWRLHCEFQTRCLDGAAEYWYVHNTT